MVDKNLTYNRDDFWVQRDGSTCRVGMSLKGLEKLKDSMVVDLPMLGEIHAGDPFLHVETSKVAHEISSPLSGTIREVNTRFLENPSENEHGNWIAVIENVDDI